MLNASNSTIVIPSTNTASATPSNSSQMRIPDRRELLLVALSKHNSLRLRARYRQLYSNRGTGCDAGLLVCSKLDFVAQAAPLISWASQLGPSSTLIFQKAF